MPLTVRQHMTLTLATTTYRHPGRRTTDVRHQLGLGETTFWATVNHLIDDPAAWAERPLEVKRLRRLRDQRQQARRGRREGFAV